MPEDDKVTVLDDDIVLQNRDDVGETLKGILIDSGQVVVVEAHLNVVECPKNGRALCCCRAC